MFGVKVMNKSEFFEKYRMSDAILDKTGIYWEDLMSIYESYVGTLNELEYAAEYLSSALMKAPKAHSVKFRIKEPEHLIEKIIRKKLHRPELYVDKLNYSQKVTDLIGARVIHLFKEDWDVIDDFIKSKWSLAEKPHANVRTGELKATIDAFEKRGCEVISHELGYRSVHYVVRLDQGKPGGGILAEIQVRTIFEEAWSEIDHQMRYPYHTDNPEMHEFLRILSQLSCAADDMGSFLLRYSDILKKRTSGK